MIFDCRGQIGGKVVGCGGRVRGGDTRPCTSRGEILVIYLSGSVVGTIMGEGSFGGSICMVVASDPTMGFDFLKKSGKCSTGTGY